MFMVSHPVKNLPETQSSLSSKEANSRNRKSSKLITTKMNSLNRETSEKRFKKVRIQTA